MSTDGLYVWGVEDKIVPDALTTSGAFQSISLPTGVNPADVKKLTASGAGGLIILTHSGDVWNLGMSGRTYGDGAALDDGWHKSNLTGVKNVRIAGSAVFAQTTAGDFYTWGSYLSKGDGSASTGNTISQPIAMTSPLPVGVTAIQMAVSATSSGPTEASYYILGSNSKVYSLGEIPVVSSV